MQLQKAQRPTRVEILTLTFKPDQVWFKKMRLINIQAAKTHLSRVVEQVVQGEDIVLAKAGKPMVRLVPYTKSGVRREPGAFKGQIWEAADCWDGDDDIAASIDRSGPLP
jgi:prevent-host-death family protein